MGVYYKTCNLTKLAIAHVAALFHDFGKVNPNFQKKLFGEKTNGYSHHAYLSAYLWLIILHQNKSLVKDLGICDWQDIVAVTAMIAKHHGNLPDLETVFDVTEADRLKLFLKKNPTLSVECLIEKLDPIRSASFTLDNDGHYTTEKILKISLQSHQNKKPLQFFLETRYAFASLINADKSDASGYERNFESVINFCKSYEAKLESFLSGLNQNTDLNRIRTRMRLEAISNLHTHLNSQQRIFALTAPTGAGKTLMLLSLAGEIIRTKGEYRIIYSLPFLSITEQVFSICQNIFGQDATRIDSRAENKQFQNTQSELDENPDAFRYLISSQLAEDTFDFPFIITTFVRFFEALLSNENSTLLKLPSFGRSVFLIDEIQALPSRLYSFFVAILDAFCKMFDSYAIISSATMPDFRLPDNDPSLRTFFSEYDTIPELLPYDYFSNSLFDRYVVVPSLGKITIKALAEILIKEDQSVLVILNTIDDTKKLYSYLTDELGFSKVILLNTHFTPNDRLRKLEIARRALKQRLHFIVVSTQLVEAGVDIDFPIVYRDLAPLSSIVQSAGRCNRHNQRSQKGRLVTLELERNGRSRWKFIYKGTDEKLVSQFVDILENNECTESELFKKQRNFFEHIRRNLLFGYHQSPKFIPNGEIYFVEKIKQAAFFEIGKFRLIDEDKFGEEIRYFVPISANDSSFERLADLVNELKKISRNDFETLRIQKIKIDSHLRLMSGQIIQVRLSKKDIKPIPDAEPCCRILKLKLDQYNPKTGIRLDSENQFI
jgi:CRISPR-associated endonuclease/helicase Cas3